MCGQFQRGPGVIAGEAFQPLEQQSFRHQGKGQDLPPVSTRKVNRTAHQNRQLGIEMQPHAVAQSVHTKLNQLLTLLCHYLR
jgi:hypothetical protein